MRIDVYLNSDAQPFQSLTPPEKFALDTTSLPDGRHKLRFVAIDRDGVTGERVIRISVQNGPSIAIHGISEDDVVQGLGLFEAFQQRRLEAIESACAQESTTELRDSAAAADAYDRVIEALKNYVEVVNSENSAWSTAEGKA